MFHEDRESILHMVVFFKEITNFSIVPRQTPHIKCSQARSTLAAFLGSRFITLVSALPKTSGKKNKKTFVEIKDPL